jgi:hypothetical protein
MKEGQVAFNGTWRDDKIMDMGKNTKLPAINMLENHTSGIICQVDDEIISMLHKTKFPEYYTLLCVNIILIPISIFAFLWPFFLLKWAVDYFVFIMLLLGVCTLYHKL